MLKFRKKRDEFIKYLVLTFGSVIALTPFIIMLLNSVKPSSEILNEPLSFPSRLDFSGYVDVFKTLDLMRLYGNTVFVAGSVALLNVLFGASIAYALTKCDLPGKKIWLKVILATMMLPSILLLIPQYQMFLNWEWLDSYKVLILPFCLSAYNVFLITQFMKGINNEFLEAARIDGASEPFILFRIVVPLSVPVLSTVGIMTFLGSWNDFMAPLLYLRDRTKMTVQVAVYMFKAAIPNGHMQQLWAAFVLVTVPIVIAYLFAQKNFIKAFTGVGLK